ncbi:LPS export ABC transporter periplasmic protein LptC [bacterium]|nr:LPS export ABC transporter periplasmic protein LptC [bacterium]
MKNIVLVLVGVMVLLVAGCGKRQPSVSQVPVAQASDNQAQTSQNKTDTEKKPQAYMLPRVDDGPKLQFSQQGVTFSWVENGHVRMSASAKEVSGGEVTRIGRLTNFSGKLYENGKLVATMTAPKVIADTTKRIVTATGGVTLKSLERNTTVRSQWMKWYAKEQKVVGDGGVKINSTMGNMQGAAFIADTAMKSIRVMDSGKGL